MEVEEWGWDVLTIYWGFIGDLLGTQVDQNCPDNLVRAETTVNTVKVEAQKFLCLERSAMVGKN